MQIEKRECVKDFDHTDKKGNHFYLRKGKVYTTSLIENDLLTVFTNYWVEMPASYFSKEIA